MMEFGGDKTRNNVRARGHHVVTDEEQLYDDTRDVSVYPKGQKKVPKAENFVERWCTSAKRES